jgi:F-type H+-transporting ATPase subunit epsilon
VADSTFPLEILTLQNAVLQTDVASLTAPGVDGRFGVLPRHEPFVFGLEPGLLEIVHPDGTPETFAVGEGVLVVRPEGVSAMVRSAERAGEIDENRAREARERAERRIRKRSNDIDMARAELALKRAIARLKAKQNHP